MSSAEYARTPGGYISDMRIEERLTIAEVAELLRMLRLCGLNRVWPSAAAVPAMLAEIETDRRRLTPPQLLSLTLVMTLNLTRYRELVARAEMANV